MIVELDTKWQYRWPRPTPLPSGHVLSLNCKNGIVDLGPLLSALSRRPCPPAAKQWCKALGEKLALSRERFSLKLLAEVSAASPILKGFLGQLAWGAAVMLERRLGASAKQTACAEP